MEINTCLLPETSEKKQKVSPKLEGARDALKSSINFSNHESKELSIIKQINREAVHKICSGQVVINLAIAVKELVENAIDAGATNIEIKLKEYGSELVEIIDNGSGVLEQNFDALTRKHFTSKLREFADLESVETLGFRGEALSSLCALSNVTITTKHSTANTATKLEFDHTGNIIRKSVVPRSEGTTVSLANIFVTLPVRRKDFTKNLKREFNKMCQLLYAYCLVSVNIKITCTNQVKNTKTTVMATQGSSSVRENIISIFGAKQTSTLIDIPVKEPNAPILEEYNIKTTPNEKLPFDFECFLSSVLHGSGRSTSDRQFYFINSRPCEPTKVMKLVNEVYKQFNNNQYPFVFLNVLIDRHHTDINVTPDKRQIYLDNEKLLMAILKTSLLDALKDFPSTYVLQNLNATECDGQPFNSSSKGLKRAIRDDSGTLSQSSLLECFRKKIKNDRTEKDVLVEPVLEELQNITTDQVKDTTTSKTDTNIVQNTEYTKTSPIDILTTERSVKREEVPSCAFTSSRKCVVTGENALEATINEINDVSNADVNKILVQSNEVTKTTLLKKQYKNVNEHIKNNGVTIINTSVTIIEQAIKEKIKRLQESSAGAVAVKFRSEISPKYNKQAEQELQKQITKDKFREMKVIGQFNLAFIVTQLENDLFIIDQHASDEKFNFEHLQRNTVLETQTLVSPNPLNLTVSSENTLIDNVDIFKKNGFIFSIDHNGKPTKKVNLTAIPVSKNYSFGKDDIDELLFMLQEGTDTVCRPSRVKQMFASRACRKSVMVGKALTQANMQKLVQHMGEIDQPWNCPHGRPTMRHLLNLNLIQET